MGKLDIFRTVRKAGVWSEVTNMKPPINSIGDDFGIVFNEDQTRGFFTSDRFNGKGKDDIFSLWKDGPQQIFFTGHEIQIPDYTLFNDITYKISRNGSKIQVPLSPGNGIYAYPVEDDTLYTLVMRKGGFFFNEVKFKMKPGDDKHYSSIDIESAGTELMIGGNASERIGRDPRDASGTDTAGVNATGNVFVEKFIPSAHVALFLGEQGRSVCHCRQQRLFLFPRYIGWRQPV